MNLSANLSSSFAIIVTEFFLKIRKKRGELNFHLTYRLNIFSAFILRRSAISPMPKNYYSDLADKVPGLTFAVLRRNHKTGANIREYG